MIVEQGRLAACSQDDLGDDGQKERRGCISRAAASMRRGIVAREASFARQQRAPGTRRAACDLGTGGEAAAGRPATTKLIVPHVCQ